MVPDREICKDRFLYGVSFQDHGPGRLGLQTHFSAEQNPLSMTTSLVTFFPLSKKLINTRMPF